VGAVASRTDGLWSKLGIHAWQDKKAKIESGYVSRVRFARPLSEEPLLSVPSALYPLLNVRYSQVSSLNPSPVAAKDVVADYTLSDDTLGSLLLYHDGPAGGEGSAARTRVVVTPIVPGNLTFAAGDGTRQFFANVFLRMHYADAYVSFGDPFGEADATLATQTESWTLAPGRGGGADVRVAILIRYWSPERAG
jgi:hypothetical protein